MERRKVINALEKTAMTAIGIPIFVGAIVPLLTYLVCKGMEEKISLTSKLLSKKVKNYLTNNREWYLDFKGNISDSYGNRLN